MSDTDDLSKLGLRRNRVIATTMAAIEREVYPQLDEEGRHRLRQAVLMAINEIHDVAAGMIHGGTVVTNELYIRQMLEEIREAVKA